WNGFNTNGSNSITATGNLTTGATLTIGSPIYNNKLYNQLRFRTIESKTPNIIKITNDDSFIYFSGNSAIIKGNNIGGGAAVFSGITGNTLQFRTIIGSGSTFVTQTPTKIILSSNISGTTTAANIGTGIGVYDSKVGSILQFRSIIGTGGTTVSHVDNNIIICGGGSGTLTGATNGLYVQGQNVLLGGLLTQRTSLYGSCLNISGVAGLNLTTTGNTNINIDAQSNGGFVIKSQSGSTNTFNNFTGYIGILGQFNSPNGFTIYDNRLGTGQTGIVYASDYSLNYVARSLVDKQYVDTVAVGLNVHVAVNLATTTNITLSGNQIIDGYMTYNGERILVKNQTNGALNGIYIATGTTWYRSPDYNFMLFNVISNGDLIPVTSGVTQSSTLWALATPDPIVSGNTLIYTEFSRIINVIGGSGINTSTVGSSTTVNIQLGTGIAVGCGLAVNNSGLCVNSNIAGNGLSYSSGIINVNACNCGSVSVIPVGYNAGNCLVIACSDLINAVNAITGATNGLTSIGCVVKLGGTISQATTIIDNRVGNAAVGIQYGGN